MNLRFHLSVFLPVTLLAGCAAGHRHSILNMLVEGRVDASMRMPHNRDQPLGAREIEILRLWVDQGAKNN